MSITCSNNLSTDNDGAEVRDACASSSDTNVEEPSDKLGKRNLDNSEINLRKESSTKPKNLFS